MPPRKITSPVPRDLATDLRLLSPLAPASRTFLSRLAPIATGAAGVLVLPELPVPRVLLVQRAPLEQLVQLELLVLPELPVRRVLLVRRAPLEPRERPALRVQPELRVLRAWGPQALQVPRAPRARLDLRVSAR